MYAIFLSFFTFFTNKLNTIGIIFMESVLRLHPILMQSGPNVLMRKLFDNQNISTVLIMV